MRVITFSKYFPSYHPKAGEPTHFIQKILHSTVIPHYKPVGEIGWPPKFHTIRAGNHWKPGDKFSARFWTGVPYRSKQEEFAQLEVKRIFVFEKYANTLWINHLLLNSRQEEIVACNDGLTVEELKQWFNKDFKGQVICWGDVNYDDQQN